MVNFASNARPISATRIQRQWPFLATKEIESVDGRVDCLYRLLIAHRISRRDAAQQIHALIREPQDSTTR